LFTNKESHKMASSYRCPRCLAPVEGIGAIYCQACRQIMATEALTETIKKSRPATPSYESPREVVRTVYVNPPRDWGEVKFDRPADGQIWKPKDLENVQYEVVGEVDLDMGENAKYIIRTIKEKEIVVKEAQPWPILILSIMLLWDAYHQFPILGFIWYLLKVGVYFFTFGIFWAEPSSFGL